MALKIVITGGLGYVGGRIAQHLAALGGYDVWLTTRRAVENPIPNTTLITLDGDLSRLDDVMQNAWAVIHLAALNEIDCVKYPYEAIDVNIKQSLQWLKAAENAGVQKFLYFSTVHVYGSEHRGVITEKNLPRPTHPYSITHKAAEDYVLAARAQSGMDALVVRLSNSFGAPVTPDVNRWTLLVNDLCRKVVETGEIILQSDGSQERDFITLTNVVRAVEHLLALPKAETQDGLFNLTSEQSVKVYALAIRIADQFENLFGRRPVLNRPEPANLNEPAGTIYSAARLKSSGFSFIQNTDEELMNMLLFCEKHFNKETIK